MQSIILSRKTITATFLERVKISPSLVGFQYKPTHAERGTVGQWKMVNFKEFYDECRLVSFGLMGLGLQPKEKVVILSNTRFEWSLCDMAILGCGAITVPIYASNTPDDVVYILDHSEARIAIVEDAKQIEKILQKKLENPSCLPHLKKMILLEPSAMMVAARYQDGSKDVMTLDALRELGRREESKNPTRFDTNLSSAHADDLITICYTSGTTGVPKGVMLSHCNILSVIEDCGKALEKHIRPEAEVIVSFLPFSHIFGKVESLAIYTFGWRQAFAENLDKLMANIGEIQPTLIFSVPRIFEKAYNKINSMVDSGPASKKKIFHWAFDIGRKYYDAVWNNKKPSLSNSIGYQLAKKIVFGSVAQRFGGQLRFAICGGAPLPREIGEFFQIVGIPILEGYGLTETSSAVTINQPEKIKFGTVGLPLPEVTFKIAEDGEVMIKSEKVFKAYYKMDEDSAKTFNGGWFLTGDIGHIDAEGVLHITDRKKDLIVTSGGKNIAPQKIENIAKSQKMVSQFVAHGDRRNYLTALITLDRDQVIQYANEQNILFSAYSELIKNPKIIALGQQIVDEVNKKLAHFETVKKFVILPDDFTVEGGELTPSLKVRRNVINKRYKSILDSMYE